MPTTPREPRPGLDRRGFLTLAGAAGVSALVAPLTRTPPASAAMLLAYPFTLGVASGDPWPDGFVIWTRLAPYALAADGRGGMPRRPVPVQWEVAADEYFRSIVARGTAVARPSQAHTVHVDVGGLDPDRWYWYRFRVGRGAASFVSPVGRSWTAPRRRDRLARMSLVAASCQKWIGGRYAAYRTMAEEDVNAVLFLGDYIYEKKRTTSLSDYRVLYAEVKSSPDLQAAHARFPFIAVFDDHEVRNNFAGEIVQNRDGSVRTGTEFAQQRANAFRALWEHLPLRRRQRPSGPDVRIHRSLAFGDLVDLTLLDTRQHRSVQVGPLQQDATPRDPAVLDPARSMLGSAQEAWLGRRLRRSRARWTVIGQQIVMAPYDYDPGPGVSISNDCWDGYPAARERLLADIVAAKASNPIVVSGDAHSAWVNELYGDPAAPPVAMEFVTPSISTPANIDPQFWPARPANPQVKYVDLSYQGYIRLGFTKDELTASFRRVASAVDDSAPAITSARWIVRNGQPGAVPG